ncbi:MAG TPA: tRNA 2-selenouridine(34) synthase MnmH [Rhodocyclaceae bacterium]
MKNPAITTVDSLDGFDAIIDTRSPAEFAEDHLPGAINCPVLDDAQRAEVGTLYKQHSPFAARRVGAALVSENIARHLRTAFADQPKQWRPLVYCWRGGQRSGAMTIVLRQVGWDARQLEGGYKAYRRRVVTELAALPLPLDFIVIGGPTGSAKSRVLQALAERGEQTLDLEALASHKGSVLGLLPGLAQPSQKAFESALWQALGRLDPARPVFVEAESRKIGRLQVPEVLIERMRAARCVAIDAPLEARVEFLIGDYDYMVRDPEHLIGRLDALRPLRGSEPVDGWIELVRAARWSDLVECLLTGHYDPLYRKSQELNYRAHGAPPSVTAQRLDAAGIEAVAAAIIATHNTP